MGVPSIKLKTPTSPQGRPEKIKKIRALGTKGLKACILKMYVRKRKKIHNKTGRFSLYCLH